MTVTALGVVTRAYGRQVFIQDSTAAINVFTPGGALFAAIQSGEVRAGDSLQVTGRLTEFQPSAGQPGTGWLMVDNVSAGGFGLWARDAPLPSPQRITLADLIADEPDGDTYESEVVWIEGLTLDPAGATVFAAATSYTVRQTVDGIETTAVLRVSGPGNATGDSELVGRPIPTGPADYVGVVNQFRGVNQLLPIRASDLVSTGGAAVESAPSGPGLSVSVSPNPAGRGVALVRLRSEGSGPVRLVVTDVLGREVAVAWDGAARTGEQSVGLDTASWPAGVYVVRAEAAGRVATARFVVARR